MGHSIPFMQALATAMEGLMFRAVLPTWLISLTQRGRQALCGFDEMEVGHLRPGHTVYDPTSRSDCSYIWQK